MSKLSARNKELAREPALLWQAREWVGYTALGNLQTEFGDRTGHRGVTWTGSFIDVCARDAGLTLPAHADSIGALAAYVAAGRLYRTPRKGDVVFFAYGPGNYTAPRVGIVSDVRGWRKYGTFKAIEGQTASGLPRGGDTENGVYERVRQNTDVLAFARPDRLPRTIFRVNADAPATVLHLTALTGRTAVPSQIALLQSALADVTALKECTRGKYDSKTRSAYRAWQRACGVGSAASGIPEANSLRLLGERTHRFVAE